MSTKGITEADKHADAARHYSDIFTLPHWEPTATSRGQLSHPQMDITKRAAMFASFDALVGYKEAVDETARTTDGRIELSEGELEELGRRLMVVIDRMEEGKDNGELPSGIIRADETSAPTVTITYFVPDATKDGGEYRTVTGAVIKIDLYQRLLYLDSGLLIRIDDVVKFDGELFDEYDSSDY